MDGLSSDFRRLMDRYQPLTPAEERELFLRHGNDRRRIEELLVLHNLKLAKCIASRYQGRTESGDDLFTIAVIGLVKAAREFDPSRGARFPTFAYYKIRSALSILTNDCLVDVKMQNVTDAVLDASSSAFTDDEDGDDRTFGETTMLRVAHDYSPPDPGRAHADAMEARECEELVREIDRRYLSREDPRNRRIVLGILRGEVQSAIARELGISREAERVRAKAAMARLRKALRRECCKWR